MIGMSQALKDAVGEWAQSRNKSTAAVARQAIADYIGYDLENEVNGSSGRRGRPRVYKDREERRLASRARAKARRKLQRQLMDDHKRQEALKQLAKFQASVEGA